jgi:hypothetical protein
MKEYYRDEPEPDVEISGSGNALNRYAGLVDADIISEEALTDLESAVGEYLATTDAAAAKRLFDARISKHRNLGLPLFRKMMTRGKPTTAMEAGTHQRAVAADGRTVPYLLNVPRRAITGPSVPLLISLVPSWMQARTERITWMRVTQATDAIVASVDMPAGASWKHGTLALEIVDGIRRDVAAAYNVDSSKVFLTAASDATDAAWHVAVRRADRFAGLILRASVPPLSQHADALHHLPIYAIHGTADEKAPIADFNRGIKPFIDAGYDVTFDVKRGREHEAFTDAGPEIAAWMQTHARPAEAWQTAAFALSPSGASGYWLEITGVRDARTAEWQTYHPDDPMKVMERRVELTNPARASAARKQIGQRITVTADNVSSLRLLFNGQKLNLNEPIEITLNGKLSVVTPLEKADPVAFMLEYARATGDRSSLYCCEVRLDVK